MIRYVHCMYVPAIHVSPIVARGLSPNRETRTSPPCPSAAPNPIVFDSSSLCSGGGANSVLRHPSPFSFVGLRLHQTSITWLTPPRTTIDTRRVRLVPPSTHNHLHRLSRTLPTCLCQLFVFSQSLFLFYKDDDDDLHPQLSSSSCCCRERPNVMNVRPDHHRHHYVCRIFSLSLLHTMWEEVVVVLAVATQ